MNTYAIYADNRFSFARLKQVAAFYYPALRLQIFLYPAISAAVGVLTYFMLQSALMAIFGGLMSFALSLMLYLAPLAFTRRSNRALEVMLPATWQEKATFIILYSIVVVPLLVYLPKYIFAKAIQMILGSSALTQLTDSLTDAMSFNLLSEVQDFVPLVTCLFVVMKCRNNRAVLGGIFSITSLVALGIMGLVIGFIAAFSTGINFGMENAGAVNEAMIAGQITSVMGPVLTAMGIICIVYVIAMLWLTARSIKRIQI